MSDGQNARFIRQDPPSDEDVAHVVSRVEQRLTRVLGRWRARRQRDSANDSDDANILPACAEVPPTELVRLLSQNEPHDRRPAPNKPLCARNPGGLELHAEVTIAAHDRKGLERLCRYLSRPPIPLDRLERRADGKLVLSLKRTTAGCGAQRPTIQNPDAITAILGAVHSDKWFIQNTGPPAQDPQLASAAA